MITFKDPLFNLAYPIVSHIPFIGIPVLLYHSIRPSFNWIGNVSPSQFNRQLARLAATHNSVSLKQVTDSFTSGKSLPPKSVALTFDDGYTDLIDHALPILERFHFTATIFITTSHRPAQKMHGRLLQPTQIRRLAKQGLDIQCHTHTHKDLTSLTPPQLTHELTQSISQFKQILGTKPTMLAYPRGKFNSQVMATASSFFSFCWTTEPMLASPHHHPHQLPRIGITRDTTFAAFKLYTTQAIDWFYNLNHL